MERRGEREFDLDAVVELDNKRREILQEVEVMKNELNVNSKNTSINKRRKRCNRRKGKIERVIR